MIAQTITRGTPWKRARRPELLVVDQFLAGWIQAVSDTYDLPRCVRSVLTFIADNTTVSLWNKFRLGINFIVRAVGFCRSSVEKALAVLRQLRVIAYDGQIDVGQQRKVAVYRLSGTPECPLPEAVVAARWEAWEDAQSVAPEWEPAEDVSAGQDRNYVWKKQLGTRTTTDQLFPRYEGSPGSPPGDIYTKPQLQEEVIKTYGGFDRWVPHLGTPPVWVAPRSAGKRLRGAVRGLLGRSGGIHPPGGLEGSQRRCEGVPGRSEGAVSYSNRSPIGRMTPMSLFSDPTFGDIPRDARLLYLGLRHLADNADQVRSDPRYLKGYVFPYDDDITPSDVDLMVNRLVEVGKVHRVPDHLVISDPGSVLIPLLADPTAKPKRRTRTVKPKPQPSVWFDAFWEVYPRNTGYGAAATAFAKAVADGHDPSEIVEAATAYADRCAAIRKEAQFIPHPATWLNQQRWHDAPEAAPQVRSKMDDALLGGMELVRFYEEQERAEREQLNGGQGPLEIDWNHE